MKVYVLGAGVSYGAGYPLGHQLFDKVAEFVRTQQSELASKWDEICLWLQRNPDPLIEEAYRRRQFEYLFTILDLASSLSVDNLIDAYHTYKSKTNDSNVSEAHRRFAQVTHKYSDYGGVLRLALENYLQYMHSCDQADGRVSGWNELRAFGERLEPGDIVITFNYDATLERVLLERGVWSPTDGYGFQLLFQRSTDDPTAVDLAASSVLVLHLHGAVGWYDKPVFRNESSLPTHGFVSRDALTPAPLETSVALAPSFLRGLDLDYVDSSLPNEPLNDNELFLYPSFLKDYEISDRVNHTFIRLWKMAAQSLRQSEEVIVIGYSLPEPDSAALSLLTTNCEPGIVTIVNPSVSANYRLRRLLSSYLVQSPMTMQQWLDATS